MNEPMQQDGRRVLLFDMLSLQKYYLLVTKLGLALCIPLKKPLAIYDVY